MNEQDVLKETFRQEASELLSELETSLLELERAPGDQESVSSVFRAFHTLKGSGAMCGFEELSQFTHHIETVYDLVRNGKMSVDKTLIDLTLKACDLIPEMLKAQQQDQGGCREQAAETLSSFQKLIPATVGAKPLAGRSAEDRKALLPSGKSGSQITYRIRFRPSRGIFGGGTNPLLLLNELRRLGECRAIAHNDEIPFLDEMDPEACYTYWDVVLTTEKDIDAIRDIFIFIEDECELKIEVIDDGTISMEEKDYRKLGEILVEKKDLSREDLKKVLNERKPIGEMLVEEGLVPPTNVQAALVEQEHVRAVRDRRLRERSDFEP